MSRTEAAALMGMSGWRLHDKASQGGVGAPEHSWLAAA